jgi:hypothetical protein
MALGARGSEPSMIASGTGRGGSPKSCEEACAEAGPCPHLHARVIEKGQTEKRVGVPSSPALSLLLHPSATTPACVFPKVELQW